MLEKVEEFVCYLSDDVMWKQRTYLETDEIACIWVEVEIFTGKSFLVGCIYRPPDSSSYLRKDFNKNFKEMLTKVNNVSMETFLLRDINVKYIVKSSHKEIKEINSLSYQHARVTQETKY